MTSVLAMAVVLGALLAARPSPAEPSKSMAVDLPPEKPKAPAPNTPEATFRRMSVDPPRSFPWVRTILATACGLTAAAVDDPWTRVGWLTLGGGLGAWATWDATTRDRPSLAGAGGRTLGWVWSF